MQRQRDTCPLYAVLYCDSEPCILQVQLSMETHPHPVWYCAAKYLSMSALCTGGDVVSVGKFPSFQAGQMLHLFHYFASCTRAFVCVLALWLEFEGCGVNYALPAPSYVMKLRDIMVVTASAIHSLELLISEASPLTKTDPALDFHRTSFSNSPIHLERPESISDHE